MRFVLWFLAVIWGALALFESYRSGFHAPETFHADLMAGLFLVGAVIAGEIVAKEPRP